MNILDKTRLFQTSVLSSLIMGLGGAAYAQVEQLPADTIPEFESNDEIVVTGSRIRRRSIETIFPTNTINASDVTDRGFTNIADALTEIPAFGGGFSDFGAQGGSTVGQNFVDFLDLGTGRTLVLVDGKRFVNSATPSLGGANGLQVDFNVIPSALIDRVDTIGVGGAAVYGADAIAGTVNVILKSDFEGLEAGAQYTITEQGDADVFNISTVAGASFDDDKGNVTFSIEHETQQGLGQVDRPGIYGPENNWNALEFFNGTTANGFEDQRAFYNNQFINIFTNGGVASPGRTFIGSFGLGGFPNGVGLVQFDNNGQLVPYAAGASIPGVSAFFSQGGDGSNLFQEVGSLQTPSERTVGTSRFKYDFNDRISARAEFLFANTFSEELTNQGGFQSFAFPGASAPLQMSINHPLLGAQARNTLIDGGVDPVDGTFFVNRLNNDIIDPADRLETSLWRFSGGFDGSFDIGEREFFWDVNFTHGESDLDQIGDFINDTAYINALDATVLSQQDIDDAGGLANINSLSGITVGLGDPVCQSVIEAAAGRLSGSSGSGITDTDLPFVQGCAPLDIFGLGRASAEALAFVTGPSQISTDSVSRQIVANLSGNLIDLPAGGLGFNIGFEHRVESGGYIPSLADQIALGRSTASLPNGGSFRTDEFYGELSVPLVSADMDIPLIHQLQAEGAYRTINVSTLDKNTEAFTVGGKYAPIEDVTFVGNYTESTRLPSIAQLFTPASGTFSFAADPCDNRNVGQAPDVARRTANCAADGIDTSTFVSDIQNRSLLGATGGNEFLVPELSKAFTVGVILEPRFIPNFSAKIDYINVQIDNAITGVSLVQLMNACYDSANFGSEPTCNNFTRDAAGQVSDFLTGQANAGLFDTEFLQVQANYNYDLNDATRYLKGIFGSKDGNASDWGEVSHSLSVFSPLKRDFAVGDEDPALNNTRGGYADPNVSANLSSNWQKDNLRIFWGVLWQDNPLVSANPLNTDEWFPIFQTDVTQDVPGIDADGRLDPANAITKGDGSQFLHNASISYNLEDVIGSSDTTLQLSVSNVFNRKPSQLENALGDFNSSQVFGRTYTARIRSRF